MGGRGASSSWGKSTSGGLGRSQTDHMAWSEPPSKVEQLAIANGISLEEAQNQMDALRSYSRAGYRDIRSAQYNNEVGTDGFQKAVAIESFIKQSPVWNGGELYRGINLSEAQINQMEIGSRVDMRGVSSWSTKRDVATEFGTTLFKVSGTKQGASVTHLARGGLSEAEVLVSGKATWTVKSIAKIGNRTVVELSED